MIEQGRMKYCNRGRGDDKVREQHETRARQIDDDKEERRKTGKCKGMLEQKIMNCGDEVGEEEENAKQGVGG